MTYKPIIVIGAARSGTKLVRDLIASHPQVDKIPYDINYVWRFGNEKLDHDEIPVENISEAVSAKIRTYFKNNHQGAPWLIEKTVSNCLRLPVVDKVFPDAHYIHLYRNGWDVIESSYRQWIAPPDWRYILAKARTFPVYEAFGYAINYGKKLFRQFFIRNQGSISSWGPIYKGMHTDLQTKPLIEVCAIQWARCVSTALRDLANLPADRVYHLCYEDFVRNPQVRLNEIVVSLNIDPAHYTNGVTANVSSGNISKGWRSLSDNQKELIEKYIEDATGLIDESIQAPR